jgi:hypothetical protein
MLVLVVLLRLQNPRFLAVMAEVRGFKLAVKQYLKLLAVAAVALRAQGLVVLLVVEALKSMRARHQRPIMAVQIMLDREMLVAEARLAAPLVVAAVQVRLAAIVGVRT